jgi:hypothetical protein
MYIKEHILLKPISAVNTHRGRHSFTRPEIALTCCQRSMQISEMIIVKFGVTFSVQDWNLSATLVPPVTHNSAWRHSWRHGHSLFRTRLVGHGTIWRSSRRDVLCLVHTINWRFVTVYTTARHWTLSPVSCIETTPQEPFLPKYVYLSKEA